jgi:hypothetical protein
VVFITVGSQTVVFELGLQARLAGGRLRMALYSRICRPRQGVANWLRTCHPGKLSTEAAMLGIDDGSITRRKAVVQRACKSAAEQALRQGRLNATVSMIGALAAADSAGPDDYRRFFMAWQATRVLRPMLTVPLPTQASRERRKYTAARASELRDAQECEEPPTTASEWDGGTVAGARYVATAPDDGGLR